MVPGATRRPRTCSSGWRWLLARTGTILALTQDTERGQDSQTARPSPGRTVPDGSQGMLRGLRSSRGTEPSPIGGENTLRITCKPARVNTTEYGQIARTCNHSFLVDAHGENRVVDLVTYLGHVKRSKHSFGRADKSAGPAAVAVIPSNCPLVVDAGRNCPRAPRHVERYDRSICPPQKAEIASVGGSVRPGNRSRIIDGGNECSGALLLPATWRVNSPPRFNSMLSAAGGVFAPAAREHIVEFRCHLSPLQSYRRDRACGDTPGSGRAAWEACSDRIRGAWPHSAHRAAGQRLAVIRPDTGLPWRRR